VPVSTNLFPITATAFLVVLAVVFLVFTAKYIGTRARGEDPWACSRNPATRSLSTMTMTKVRGSTPKKAAPKPAARIGRSQVSPRAPHQPSLHVS
jgi:hypothetical protein